MRANVGGAQEIAKAFALGGLALATVFVASLALATLAEAQWQKGTGQLVANDPVDEPAYPGIDYIRMGGTSANTGNVGGMGDVQFWMAVNTCTGGLGCNSASAMPRAPAPTDFAGLAAPVEYFIGFQSEATNMCYVLKPSYTPGGGWSTLDFIINQQCTPQNPVVSGGYCCVGWTGVVQAEWVCNEAHFTVPRYYFYPVTPPPGPVPPDGTDLSIMDVTSLDQNFFYDQIVAPVGSPFVGNYTLGTQGLNPNPTGLVASLVTGPPDYVQLDWIAPLGGNVVTGYRIERAPTATGPWTLAPPNGPTYPNPTPSPAAANPPTTWRDYTLTPGATYYYRVQVMRCNDQSVLGGYTNVAGPIVIPAPPVSCTVSTPMPVFPGQSIAMTASGGASYTWSAPSGSPSSAPSGSTFSTTYATSGPFTVTVTSGGQNAVCSITVTPWPAPICSPAAPSVLTNNPVTLTGSGGDGVTYTWSGGGTPSGGGGMTFTTAFGTVGSYPVQLASGGASVTCTVTVLDAGTVFCAGNSTFNINTPQTFTGTGGDGVNYAWTAQGGNPSSGAGASFLTEFASGGAATITVTSGGQSADCDAYVVQPCGSISADFTVSTANPMRGQSVSFVSTIGGSVAAILWDFGDGGSTSYEHPSHTFTEAGTYHIRLTATEQGSNCIALKEMDILVGAPEAQNPSGGGGTGSGGALAPVAYAGPDQNVVEGTTVQLHGSANGEGPDGLVFMWRLVQGPAGVPTSATGSDFSFTAPMLVSAEAPITLVYELRIARGSAVSLPVLVQIMVGPSDLRPFADAGPDMEVARGAAGSLDGSLSADPDGSPLTYSWQVMAGEPLSLAGATSATPTFTVGADSAGTFADVQLTVSDGRWTSVDTVRVWIVPAAHEGFEAREQSPGTFVFIPTLAAGDFTWSFGDGAESAEVSPVHTYTEDKTYTVRLTVKDASGQERTFTESVTVRSGPVATAGVPAASSSALPWILAAAGSVALLGTGAVLFFVARRRKM